MTRMSICGLRSRAVSEIERKRETLERRVETYLSLIDQAIATIGDTEYTPATYDVTSVLDTVLPLPFDDTSIERSSLKALEERVANCTSCPLGSLRTQTVFGEGTIPARLMVIGEGPGADEDVSGRAFVGRAGQYLDSWLKAIHLERDKGVYLANIIKCRPPENRDPLYEEKVACLPYLKRQIQLVNPQILLLVGRTAAQTLLESEANLGEMRGRFHRYEGIPAIVTYHPAAVLRNVDLKRPVWEDLQRVAAFLGIDLGRR